MASERETQEIKIAALARKVKEQRKVLRGLNRSMVVAKTSERNWFLQAQYWRREHHSTKGKLDALREIRRRETRTLWERIADLVRPAHPERGPTDE